MNSTVQKMNSFIPTSFNKAANSNILPSANSSANTGSTFGSPLIWFIGFLVIFLVIFAYYYDSFMRSMQNWTDSINTWLTGTGSPPDEPPPSMQLAPPVAPQDENGEHATGMERVVERVLPPAKEVFSVSKNDYSYYDAAPLYANTMEVGMVFTIEPMLTLGTHEWDMWPDGWTVATKDKSITAQFEHTLVVTESGAQILTLP
jgi:hypothetical protein